MIIRCDQCKTRFRLDDSKVTVSGVRVRCSKCKHTFVVRKEEHEDDLAVEETSYNPEGSSDDAPKQDDYSMGNVTERAENEKKSDEINFSCESVSASGLELPGVTGDDNTYSVEDDFHLFRAGRSGSGLAMSDEELEEERIPFQWGAEEETEANQEQEVDAFGDTTKEAKEENDVISWGMEDISRDYEDKNSLIGDSRPTDTIEEMPTEIQNNFYLSETESVGSQENSQADGGLLEKAADSDGQDEFSLGCDKSGITDDQMRAEKDQPFSFMHVTASGIIRESGDLTEVPAVKEPERELLSIKSGAESGFSVSHSGDGSEEIMPPLSITSRRKRTMSLAKILAGIFTFVLVVVIAGLYFFREDLDLKNIPGFSSLINQLMTGRWNNGETTIKNLEGTFVRNKNGVDVFVIRGEVSNQSEKKSSSLRIQGHIYGANGEIQSNRYAYFKNVLSDEQLAELPVNEIEALSGTRMGSAQSDLILQPAERVPFQVLFLNVSEGAREFGAEIIALTTSGP